MVTVLQIGQLKYKINQTDHNPPHVHVEGGGATLRVNLLTLEVMDESTEFSKAMVRKIVTYIAEHKEELLEKWVEYHEKN
jgi:autonomous glycyl radical cofactor GrcA